MVVAFEFKRNLLVKPNCVFNQNCIWVNIFVANGVNGNKIVLRRPDRLL